MYNFIDLNVRLFQFSQVYLSYEMLIFNYTFKYRSMNVFTILFFCLILAVTNLTELVAQK
jgi:hypothetical protein